MKTGIKAVLYLNTTISFNFVLSFVTIMSKNEIPRLLYTLYI